MYVFLCTGKLTTLSWCWGEMIKASGKCLLWEVMIEPSLACFGLLSRIKVVFWLHLLWSSCPPEDARFPNKTTVSLDKCPQKLTEDLFYLYSIVVCHKFLICKVNLPLKNNWKKYEEKLFNQHIYQLLVLITCQAVRPFPQYWKP